MNTMFETPDPDLVVTAAGSASDRKTSATASIPAALLSQRVLYVDLDPQPSAAAWPTGKRGAFPYAPLLADMQ